MTERNCQTEFRNAVWRVIRDFCLTGEYEHLREEFSRSGKLAGHIDELHLRVREMRANLDGAPVPEEHAGDSQAENSRSGASPRVPSEDDPIRTERVQRRKKADLETDRSSSHVADANESGSEPAGAADQKERKATIQEAGKGIEAASAGIASDGDGRDSSKDESAPIAVGMEGKGQEPTHRVRNESQEEGASGAEDKLTIPGQTRRTGDVANQSLSDRDVDEAKHAAAGLIGQRTGPPDHAADASRKGRAVAVSGKSGKSDPSPTSGDATKRSEPGQPEEQGEPATGERGAAHRRAGAPAVVEKGQAVVKPTAAAVVRKSIRLSNSTVGKDYEAKIPEEVMPARDLLECRVAGLEDTGLEFDVTSRSLRGKPLKAGEFAFVLKFRQSTQIDPKRFIERELLLTVNADPRSLWKNLPSDSNELYWKPDSHSDALCKDRRLIAASQRGRSHANVGSCRDDDFQIRYVEEGRWYLVAVADGAGYAKYSRKGSEIACRVVLNTVMTQIDSLFNDELAATLAALRRAEDSSGRKKVGDALYTLLGGAAHAAMKAIQEESKTQAAAIKDYATTLLVVVAKKYDFGWFIGAFWVGDGGIGIYRKGKSVRLLGVPDGGEFAGQTRFLTMPEIWEAKELFRRLRFEIVDDFTAVVLMTDGVSDPKFGPESELMNLEKWDRLWTEVGEAAGLSDGSEGRSQDLLRWLDFWAPGEHDDRTIAILC